MLKLLYILGVAAIPFNDFYPLLPLGEIQYELSVYVFFAAIGMFFVTHEKVLGQIKVLNSTTPFIRQPLGKIAILLMGSIAFSFVMNFPDMFGGKYHGRYPIEKFVTSTATVSYGLVLAYLTYVLSRIYSWHEVVIKPIAISVAICSIVACFELLAWAGGPFRPLYVVISKFTHLGYDFTFDVVSATKADWLLIGRARSICFEPPSLANFAGFAWPWTFAGIFTTSKRAKPVYILLWLMCTVLILIANSRTSILLLPSNFFILFLLSKIYLPKVPGNSVIKRAVSTGLVMGTIILLLVFFTNTDKLTDAIMRGTSTSNITRYSLMSAAVHMFLSNPVWGYGFGQFGFHVIDFMPPWGYYSWEIKEWLVSTFTFWPPVFSIFARFAAELGIIGVVIWISTWIILARTVYRVTLAYQIKTGELLPMSYPLIMSCYCTLLSGIALDSLRTPMMWIGLGLCCSYIYTVRAKLVKLQS